ncbi:Crp/Fnr family transcriptional regulator [Chitinophaga agrisoli]|uniref:Crp/Fnr family transcriptional regulator n=1 Tax=Chitinophaga agrisoli TaxID=2607653 RepID=A0A5B2VL60_9BACT|nr:Crp/Fnr family transcriptional regulator [Chitinophaga agrisoli]KAA2239831.1 Crp/Fnr family transcriptional regulator [Chitinophaga agrisoli]
MHATIIQEFKKHIQLTVEEEALITASFRYKKVRRNQVLVQPPDIALYEHFVISGCLVEYYLDDNGTQHTLSFAPQGWWMTDLRSFLMKQESRYFVETVEDSELLIVTREQYDELLRKIPLLNNYFRILYQNAIIGQEERLLNVLSTKVDERYLRFLKKYPQLENRLPQYLIASYLGVTPEFFSRVKSKISR